MSYRILDSTSEKFHPRQYLLEFKRLEPGNYPNFIEYPKTIFDFQNEELDKLDKQLQEVAKDKVDMIHNGSVLKGSKAEKEIIDEEHRRLLELERKCLQNLISKREFLKIESEKLESMRTNAVNKRQKSRERRARYFTDDDHVAKAIKVKEQYLFRLKDLLKYRYMVEEMLEQEKMLGNLENQNILKKHQKYIAENINEASKSFGTTEDLKKLDMATGLDVLELLIRKIETELNSDRYHLERTPKKVSQIHKDTNKLEVDVKTILEILSNNANSSHNTKDHYCQHNKEICDCNLLCTKKSVRFN